MYKINTMYARGICFFEIRSLARMTYGVYFFYTRRSLVYAGTLSECRRYLKEIMTPKGVEELIKKEYEGGEYNA